VIGIAQRPSVQTHHKIHNRRWGAGERGGFHRIVTWLLPELFSPQLRG